MKNIPLLLLAAALTFVATACATPADYQIVARFKIGGDTSGYDYLRVDPAARRLYVSHGKRFEVLDADTGNKIGEIGPVNPMMKSTRTNDNWKPGVKSSFVSQARIATAAAPRLFTATAGRPKRGAARTNAAITVARTQLELKPVTTA